MHRVNDMNEIVSLGQKVIVRIMQIDRSGPKMRIKRQYQTSRWIRGRARREAFRLDSQSQESNPLMAFGAFVEFSQA